MEFARWLGLPLAEKVARRVSVVPHSGLEFHEDIPGRIPKGSLEEFKKKTLEETLQKFLKKSLEEFLNESLDKLMKNP